LVFEDAFVVLVVGAFVGGEVAGGLGVDGLACYGVVDRAALGVGLGAGDFALWDVGVGGELVEEVVFAVWGGGDAALVVWVGGEDGFGGFPDGVGVFVEGEFVEDEVAGEAAGGAWVGGEDFDSSGGRQDAGDPSGDSGFGVEGFEFGVGGEVVLFDGRVF